MESLGLVDVLNELRRELATAAQSVASEEVQFPVGEVTVQLQVGVTQSTDVNGGVRFWVLGIGGSHEHARESGHTITVELGPPIDSKGQPIKVASDLPVKPD